MLRFCGTPSPAAQARGRSSVTYGHRRAGDALKAALGTDQAVGSFVTKYVPVNGTHEGNAGRKLVFTGSHNYSYAALRANDETLLKSDNAGLYDQFKENHAKIMSYCEGS